MFLGPTLQTGPLRIGVDLSSSLSWRLESRTVTYQYRLANKFFFFTWVTDWVPASGHRKTRALDLRRSLSIGTSRKRHPILGDTYRDFRLVLESSAESSRAYGVYVNDSLDKPVVLTQPIFRARSMKTECSGSSLRTPRTEVFQIPKVSCRSSMMWHLRVACATLFATEYGILCLGA